MQDFFVFGKNDVGTQTDEPETVNLTNYLVDDFNKFTRDVDKSFADAQQYVSEKAETSGFAPWLRYQQDKVNGWFKN